MSRKPSFIHFNKKGVMVGAACGISLLLSSGQAAAQAGQVVSASGVLEEIVVTSRRREESLQSLPLSIVAITASQMQTQGIYSVDQAAQFVPNVTLTTSNRANQNRVVIRGIGGGHPDPVFAFGSGMYVDGHYMPSSLGGFMSTTDIERIELLRGPQGTLFGKNVTGGAVNIISTKPQAEFDSSILTRITDDGQQDVRAMVNIPLSDKFFARIGAGSEEFDGYYRNQLLNKDSGSTDQKAIRAAFRYLPSDNTTVDLVLEAANKRDDNAGGSCYGQGPLKDAPRWGGGAGNLEKRLYEGAEQAMFDLCDADIAAGDFVNSSEKNTFSDVDTRGGSLGIQHNLEDAGYWNAVGFTTRASLRNMELRYFADRDYVSIPVDAIGTVGPGGANNDTISVEVLMEAEVNDQFQFTFGVNYFEETAMNGNNSCYPEFVASGAATNPASPGVLCSQNGLHFEMVPNASGTGQWPNGPRRNAFGPGPFFNNVDVWNKSSAVFFNGTYDFNDDYTLDFGGRYTSDDRTFDNIEFPSTGCDFTKDPRNHCAFSPVANYSTVIGDGFFNTASETFTSFTPMVSLKRNFNNGMIYALYSEGFLTGGFNTEINSSLPAVASLLTYNPENVANYELGYKGSMRDGAVQISADIFYMDYTNQQRSQNLPNPDFAFGADDPIGVVQNVASSAIYGVEFEMRAVPWDGGYMSLDVGYLSNEYDNYSYVDPTSGALKDFSNVLINDMTPDFTANLAIEHTVNLASGATLSPRVNVYYRSGLDWAAQIGDYPLSSPKSSVYQPGVAKTDLRLTFVPAEGDWQIASYVNNLTDERIIETADTSRSVWRRRLQRPRHIGVEFNMHFGR